MEAILTTEEASGPPSADLDLREVINAISYLLNSGCRWSMLPHEFPPWGVVHGYFRRWRNNGTWEHVQKILGDTLGASAPPTEAEEEEPEYDAIRGGHEAPLRRLRIARVCPYLGSRSDRMTRRGYPSTQNVCRAAGDSYERVTVETQDQQCLAEEHVQCERYQARLSREAEQDSATG